MRILRPLLLCLVLAALGWFQFGQPLTARALIRRAEDSFDRRPARTVLILGNSRTFFNDMPDMVRAMADSAQDPRKFEITLDAPAGASFEILWDDARTQDLLKQPWDDIVLQPESRAQATDDLNRSFQTYGDKLVRAARPRSGAPRLVVNWVYEARLWDDGDPDGTGRNAYFAAIQSATAALGERTGARLVNIGRLWGEVASDHPSIALTLDGNHPTLAGSYLFALLLYGDLSGTDLGAVSYVPTGLDPATAKTLRQAARDYQAMS